MARLESDASVTLTGDFLGTIRYMSPEQAAATVNRQRSIALDNYQLALTALEETLSEYVIGDLSGDEPMNGHQRELLRRGIQFYEQFAERNAASLDEVIVDGARGTFRSDVSSDLVVCFFRSLHFNLENLYDG